MAIRIFNTCTNTHYLDEMGIEGLFLNVNDSKDNRHVCSCGWVDRGDIGTCPNCGNTKWISVSANTWHRGSAPIGIKVKEPVIKPLGAGFEVIETILVISETSTKQLELHYDDYSVMEIDLWKLEYKNRPRACVGEATDLSKYLIAHLNEITDESIKESILEAKRVSDSIWGGNNNLSMCYKLIGYPCVMHLFTDENLVKYKKFFYETFNRSNWNSADPYPSKTCLTIEEFFKVVGLPIDYINYYASSDFSYGYYYYRSSDEKIDVEALHKLPEELQRTMKSCLEHKTIGMNVIREILSWAKNEKDETLVVLAKFMKRHGMQYQGRVFDHFRNYLSMARESGYPEDTILQPRRFSMLEAMALLKHRGFPDSRISGFCDVFDVNPSYGLGLLGSKAQLKKAEAEKIYNK